MTRLERKSCRAKTRAGSPCMARGQAGGGRCKLHGGRSTGPKTAAGKAKVASNLPCVRALLAGKKDV